MKFNFDCSLNLYQIKIFTIMIEFIVGEFSISIYDNLQDVIIKIDE